MPVPLAAAAMLPQAILGIHQWSKGQKELNALHRQAVPVYGETPEQAASRQRAEYMSQKGYTGAETSAFRQNVAQDIATQSQRALDVGGASLGRVVGGMGKINTLGAEARFAADDAALHRQNIRYADRFSQELQRISDMNIREQLSQRKAAEQALGGAVKTGTENVVNALSLGGLYAALGGGAGKTSPATAPAASPSSGAPSAWLTAALNNITGKKDLSAPPALGSIPATPQEEASASLPQGVDWADYLSKMIANPSKRPQ